MPYVSMSQSYTSQWLKTIPFSGFTGAQDSWPQSTQIELVWLIHTMSIFHLSPSVIYHRQRNFRWSTAGCYHYGDWVINYRIQHQPYSLLYSIRFPQNSKFLLRGDGYIIYINTDFKTSRIKCTQCWVSYRYQVVRFLYYSYIKTLNQLLYGWYNWLLRYRSKLKYPKTSPCLLWCVYNRSPSSENTGVCTTFVSQ